VFAEYLAGKVAIRLYDGRRGFRRRRCSLSRIGRRGRAGGSHGIARSLSGSGWLVRCGIKGRLRLQLVLAGLGDQPAVTILFGPLKLAEIIGDLLFADAEEATDADDHRLRLAGFVEDHVADLADAFGIVSGPVIDGFTNDIGGEVPVRQRHDGSRGRVLNSR